MQLCLFVRGGGSKPSETRPTPRERHRAQVRSLHAEGNKRHRRQLDTSADVMVRQVAAAPSGDRMISWPECPGNQVPADGLVNATRNFSAWTSALCVRSPPEIPVGKPS